MTTHAGLSVIIPNYNHARELERAVTSHLGQSRPPLEIVLVDDASTDDSRAVIDRLVARHPQVRAVYRTERGGPNEAIRSGLALIQSDLVRFAAADDFVGPEFVAGALASLERHPEAAFCFTDPCRYDAAQDSYETVPLALAPAPAYLDPDRMFAALARNYFTISSNTVVFRRARIEEVGGFPPELEWQADWFMNLVLSFRHGVCYRPEAHAYFNERRDSYGSRGVRSAAGQKRLLEACLAALEGPYADVRPAFRKAGVVPEMRLRTLVWLLGMARGRAYLTPKLAGRLILREGWALARPLAPTGTRRWLRRAVRGAPDPAQPVGGTGPSR